MNTPVVTLAFLLLGALSSAAPLPSTQTVPFNTTYDISLASDGFFNETSGEIQGHFPEGAGPFPLFVMLPGTGGFPHDETTQIIVRRMVSRGFASVAVQYPDNTHLANGTLKSKARAVADVNNSHSAFSVLCRHESIDCSTGIALFGYSQGTLLSVLVSEYNPHIGAAFIQEGSRNIQESDTTICDNVNVKLPKHKRRYMLGEGDQYFAEPMPWNGHNCEGGKILCPSEAAAETNLKTASGFDCGSNRNCLQEDGSGYYVFTTADTGDAQLTPDHFNWMAGGKTRDVSIASWYDNAHVAWGFPAGLDWLARASQQRA